MFENENINRMNTLLSGIKQTYPHLRFGQIIVNACMRAGYDADVFYVDDKDMLDAIENYWRELEE